jgi:hypothetical protein
VIRDHRLLLPNQQVRFAKEGFEGLERHKEGNTGLSP